MDFSRSQPSKSCFSRRCKLIFKMQHTFWQVFGIWSIVLFFDLFVVFIFYKIAKDKDDQN